MSNSYWYTLGRVISEPTEHKSKGGKTYTTVYVELLGSMRVSALAGTLDTTKDMYVGVKITPKKDGQAAYSLFKINDCTEEMIICAASYIDALARADDEELPF